VTSSVRTGRVMGLSAFTLVMVAVLATLGFWQLARKTEKVALITALDQRLGAAPVPLPPPADWATLTPEHDEFRRVSLTARRLDMPDVQHDARVFASGSALRSDVSGLGAFVFAPVRLTTGETVVVERGFLPDGQRAAREFSAADDAPLSLTGYLRFPEAPGLFTPKPDLAKRLWFARDTLGMAASLGWGKVAPFYIDLETPAPPTGWPKPAALEVHIRDQHLQYAVTWFGLAIVVAAAFAFWLRGQRRGPA
jgi:cytochrome oxidase assembly protein ShyY1